MQRVHICHAKHICMINLTDSFNFEVFIFVEGYISGVVFSIFINNFKAVNDCIIKTF